MKLLDILLSILLLEERKAGDPTGEADEASTLPVESRCPVLNPTGKIYKL